MNAIIKDHGTEGAKTTNKATGNSLSVELLEKREQGADTHYALPLTSEQRIARQADIVHGRLWTPYLSIDLLRPRKHEQYAIHGLHVPHMSISHGSFEANLSEDLFDSQVKPLIVCANFVMFLIAIFVMPIEFMTNYRFENPFIRRSVGRYALVGYTYSTYTDFRKGSDHLTMFIQSQYYVVAVFFLNYYYTDWWSFYLLTFSSVFAGFAIKYTVSSQRQVFIKKALWALASLVFAPIAEEYSRHGYTGMSVLLLECVPRLLASVLVLYVVRSLRGLPLSSGYRETWWPWCVAVYITVAFHLCMYLLPLSLPCRIVLHALYNYRAYHSQLSDGTFELHSATVMSVMAPANDLLELDEIIEWYNYYVKKGRFALANEMMQKAEFLEHAQVYGYFSRLWNNNPIIGAASASNNTMTGLIDHIKNMRLALPVHVKHEIGVDSDTLESLKTVAWLAATVSIVEALVRKDLPEQDGYADVLGRLAVIAGVLGILNLEKIKNMVTGFFAITGQTNSDSSPVNLLIDGAGMFIFGKLFSSTPHGSLANLVTNFGTIGRSVTNATTFMQKVLAWVQDLILYVASCFGIEVRMANGPYTEEIDRMESFLERIHHREYEGVTITYKEIDVLKESVKRLNQMYKLSDRNGISSVTRTFLVKLTKNFEVTLKRVGNETAKLGHRDKGPWNVHIVGPPGNGKTEVTKMLGKTATERTLEPSLRDQYDLNPEHFEPFNRSISDKYYSGLKNNCKVVILPDCFQGTDKEGDVESEANCFIHLHSSEMMAATQAVAELKGYIFLNPIVVISDSNWLGQGDGPKSIKEKGALIRRANRFCWILATIPNYRKSNPACTYKLAVEELDDNGCDAYTSMLDTTKAAAFIKDGGRPWELWQLRRWDMNTIKPMQGSSWVSFMDFVKISLADFDTYWSQGMEATQAFAPCMDMLKKMAYEAAETLPVESPVFRAARPQTLDNTEVDALVSRELANPKDYRYSEIRSLLGGDESVELMPHELSLVEFVKEFDNPVLLRDLTDNLELVSPFLSDPRFKSICQTTEFEFKELPKVCLASDVGAIRCLFLKRMGDFATSYTKSLAKALTHLPDSYFSLDFVRSKFPSLPPLTFKNGAVACGIISALCSAYYYFQKKPNLDTKFVRVSGQTTSNMTNTEMFINRYTGNQLYMVLEVIPLDKTRDILKWKETNYVTMLRGTCGITVTHCLKEADYYMSSGLYAVNVLLFSFDDHERDFSRPTHRVPYSSIKRYDTVIPDIVMLDFGYSIKKYPDLYQHLPTKGQLDELLTGYNEYEIHYMSKPDDEIGQHKRNSGIATPASAEYATGEAFKCFFTDQLIFPGKAQVIRQARCLKTTLSYDGTCGLITFVKPEASLRKKNSKYNQPVPVAIHVAGAKLSSDGFEAILFREAFDFAFSDREHVPPADDYMDLKEYYASLAAIAESHGHKSAAIPPIVVRDLAHEPSPIGQKVIADIIKVAPPLKSSIVASPFKAAIASVIELDEPLHRANLGYKRNEDGSYITVVDANRVNYGRNPGGAITAEALSVVSSYYTQHIKLLMEGVGENYRKYSTSQINLRDAYEKLISGGEGNNEVRYSVLGRTQSIGSTLQYLTDIKTRHDIFGNGYFPVLGSDAEKMLWSMVEHIHGRIMAGEPILAIYKAMPKDELLPASKAAVKTRLFSVGDLAMLIINMIYFRDFIGVFKATRSRTGFMVGINPYDLDEWSSLAIKLRQYDGRCAMLDISKFDMSVSSPLLQEFKKFITSVMDMLYANSDGDFSEDQRVRSILLDKLQDFIMLYDIGGKTTAVHMSSSIPSGHYLTSAIGSLVNGLTSFAAKVSLKLDSQTSSRLSINSSSPDAIIEACKYVANTTFTAIYGDDSGFSTSDPKCFNVPDLCAQFDILFGITATNESAGRFEMDHYGFVPVNAESQIIGRGFRFEPMMGKYLAPLRYSSLVKAIAFDKVEHTQEIKRNKYDAFLREVSLHGYEFHSAIVRAVKDVARVELSYMSPYEDFSLALHAVTSGLYLPDWEQDVQVSPQSSGKLPRAARIASAAVYCAISKVGDLDIIKPESARIIHPPPVKRISLCNYCTEDHCRIVKSADFLGECIPNLQAQSSSSPAMEGLIGTRVENTEHVTDVVCTEAGMTCFEDGAAIKHMDVKGSSVTRVPDISETIAEFLERPQLLTSGAWSVNDSAQAFIYALVAIGDLVTSGSTSEVVPWTDKLKGYSLMSGTFVIRFVLNASKFMQGSLIHFFIPNYNQYLAANKTPIYDNLTQQFQLNHVIMTTEDTAVEFEMPFMGPYGYHVLGTGSQTIASGNVDWGAFITRVMTPLRVGPNALITSADIQVFGHWKDVKVAGPIVPQSSSKRAKGRKIVDGDKVDKPISSTLSKVSVAANAMSGVPLIGSFMNNLSWVAGVASGVASAFGYSKPLANSHYMIVSQQPMKYVATADGPETAVPLSLISDNKTEFLTDLSTTGEDEMSLKFLVSRVHYTDTINWTTSAVTGASLLTKYIGPANLQGNYTNILTNTATYTYGGPMYYLGNFFQYWRGSIIVNIKIFKTQIHTGRLMIVFTPRPYGALTTSPTIANSTYSLREIVDLRTQSEVTLTLPYIAASDYLPVRPRTLANSFVNASGRLDIFVLNELRCSETVASSVDMIVTFKAGPDFEFQVPTRAQYLTDGTGVQAGDNSSFSAVPFIPATVVVGQTSNEKAVDSTIGAGSVPDMDIGPSTRCVGEFISSVKQLICRQSTGYFFLNTAYRGILVNPHDIVSATVDSGAIVPTASTTYTGILWGDMLSYIAPMYMYYKGSMIVDNFTPTTRGTYGTLVIDPPVSYPFVSAGPYDNAQSSNNGTTTFAYGPKISTANTLMSVANSSSLNRIDNCLQSFVVPYYNSTRCAYVVNRKATVAPTSSGDYFRSKCALQISYHDTTSGANNRIARRCGDDYQLSQFLCCPPLLTRAP